MCLCCPYWEHWNVNLSEFRLEIYSLFLIHFYVTWISIFRDPNKFRIPYNWVLSLILIQKAFQCQHSVKRSVTYIQQQTTPRHFPRVVFSFFFFCFYSFSYCSSCSHYLSSCSHFSFLSSILYFFSFPIPLLFSSFCYTPLSFFNMFINIKFLWMRFQPSLEEKILVSFSLHNQVWDAYYLVSK